MSNEETSQKLIRTFDKEVNKYQMISSMQTPSYTISKIFLKLESILQECLLTSVLRLILNIKVQISLGI